MAKRKSGTKTTKTRTVRVRSASPKRRRSPGTKSFMSGKIKWGEAALAALTGYFGGDVLEGSGLAPMLYYEYPQTRPYLFTYAQGSTYGDSLNKDLGMVAGAKVVYDVVKHHKLSSEDTNLLIPYIIGTVFDKNKSDGTSDKGVW